MRFLHWITGLIWPARCLGCGAYDTCLCRKCLNGISFRTHQECIVCKRSTKDGTPCRACSAHTMVDKLFIAGHTDHPLLSAAIYALKYSYLQDLAGPLAECLSQAIAEKRSGTALDDPLFVPVPLHPERLRRRGFNQSELLARELTARIGMACAPEVLVRDRNTASQVSTASRWERLENMRDAFQVPHPFLVAGRHVVLIDDVCTTGATLDACAHALKKAGALTVSAMVLARG